VSPHSRSKDRTIQRGEHLESLERAYPGSKKTRIFWAILIVIIIGVAFLQTDILMALNIDPRTGYSIDFFLGSAFMLLMYHSLVTLFRPRMRICTHFLVSDYDRKVVSWDHVKRVKIKGKYLHLETPESRLLGTFILDLSCIYDMSGLIDNIKRVCEDRGIPFENQ
jgi:hypothetical protein